LRSFNQDLAIFATWLIVTIVYLSIYVNCYFDYYSFFIPKYLDKWYQMFSYKNIIEIENELLKNNMSYELIKVYLFKSGLNSFYLGICFAWATVTQFYYGIKRNEVCRNGIYFRRYMCKWEKISEYECKGPLNKKRKRGNIEYYKLILHIKNGKFQKRISNEDTHEKIIKVKSIDKDKVEEILKNSIIKEII